MPRPHLLCVSLCLATAAAHLSAAEPPREWVEATGHRVVRLSDQAGSRGLYFHQNAYLDGRTLLISTPRGLATVDLQTREQEIVVPGRASQVVVGKRTGTVYYLSGRSVMAKQVKTGDSRTIAELPDHWGGGAGFAVNADETLLAGCATENAGGSRRRGAGSRRRGDLQARLDARLPMTLYTIEIASGRIDEIHQGTDWFNHLQFSPTDPQLLMFCHEGPWHKVDRIWTIRVDGGGALKIHTRTMDMEIAGHEFFSPDGQTIWYDLQTPKRKEFWLAGADLAGGTSIRYPLAREHWSVHYNSSPDGKLFAGDGGGPSSVAAPGNGQWIYLFTPSGPKLEVERLVDLAQHNYDLEPNVTFTPDGEWVVFSSNMHGPAHVYAVSTRKAPQVAEDRRD